MLSKYSSRRVTRSEIIAHTAFFLSFIVTITAHECHRRLETVWQSDFGSSPVVSSALVADFNGDNVRDVLAGMEDAYRNDRGTHQLIKQLMALSYLPADKIERRFRRLQQQATVRPLQGFCSYIEENWITSQTFPPQTWSVFLEAVRTNNDLEGWHNGLNRRAKGRSQLLLYILIQVLHREAALVSMQIRLVSDKKLKRHQHSTYRTLQRRLFDLWSEFENGNRNSKELLEACAHLVQPM